MRVLPYGPRAVLVEFDTLDEVVSAADVWRRYPLSGLIEVVPAARTVLMVHDGTLDPASISLVDATHGDEEFSSHPPAAATPSTSEVVIPVRYDGADLAEVAAACDLSIDEVVRLHGAARYTVAFCGFMPGFAYLVGLPPELRRPRRATPRSRVPAGSVAIADEYCGIYPQASPGGWHLLGSTDVRLWNDACQPPALLSPGTRVRFVNR